MVTLVADKLRRQWLWKVYLLETNGIRQLERKQAQIILNIILQILTPEQTSARETSTTIKGMSLICSCSDLASVPMIVSEMM